MRAAAAHAVASHAGGWLQAPLDTLISTQRAALLPPIDGDGDDDGDLGGTTALEESPVDVEEAAVAALQHPGQVLSCYTTRQAALQTYIGQPPACSLAGSTFWGEDHDSAETQLRSFATACHLPRDRAAVGGAADTQHARAARDGAGRAEHRAAVAASASKSQCVVTEVVLYFRVFSLWCQHQEKWGTRYCALLKSKAKLKPTRDTVDRGSV